MNGFNAQVLVERLTNFEQFKPNVFLFVKIYILRMNPSYAYSIALTRLTQLILTLAYYGYS
jgi:hypothetical protein